MFSQMIWKKSLLLSSEMDGGEVEMKVKVSAASSDDRYPTITGYHDFESLDKAVDYVRIGAKKFDKEEGDDLILYFPRDGKRTDGADVEIIIYDYYVE